MKRRYRRNAEKILYHLVAFKESAIWEQNRDWIESRWRDMALGGMIPGFREWIHDKAMNDVLSTLSEKESREMTLHLYGFELITTQAQTSP